MLGSVHKLYNESLSQGIPQIKSAEAPCGLRACGAVAFDRLNLLPHHPLSLPTVATQKLVLKPLPLPVPVPQNPQFLFVVSAGDG